MGKKILNFFLLLAIVGTATFLIPMSIGLGAGGFDSAGPLQQISFYTLGIGFALFLAAFFIVELVIRRKDKQFGDSVGFASQGETPSFSVFKRFTPFQLFLLCVIIFSILGFFLSFKGQNTFTGVGALEQQFTPTAQTMFSTLLVAGSENLGLALVIAICLVSIRAISRKRNWSANTFRFVCLGVIPIIGMFYWIINHLLRYSNQDVALFMVALFGLVQTFIVIITGSFIAGWVMHMANNLFYDLQRYFVSDTMTVYIVAVLILVIILYVFMYRGRLFGRKQS